MEGPAGRTRSDVKHPLFESGGHLHHETRSGISGTQTLGKPSIGTATVASGARRLEFPACPRPNPLAPPPRAGSGRSILGRSK